VLHNAYVLSDRKGLIRSKALILLEAFLHKSSVTFELKGEYPLALRLTCVW